LEPSDETLAFQAQQGDKSAFDELVRRNKAPLYRFVRRYVGDRDDAYDIVQDAFISAWGALKRYDPNRAFATWLRTIALNKCRDFGRRRAVRRLLLRAKAVEPVEPETYEATREAVAVEVRETVRLRRLDQAIAALPAFYKEPLLLTMVSGLSHQDAARQLKTSAKAIEMRLRRARKKLTAALSDLA
jgi:RNA polymerase sigma-70 factor (ECF subfamily)